MSYSNYQRFEFQSNYINDQRQFCPESYGKNVAFYNDYKNPSFDGLYASWDGKIFLNQKYQYYKTAEAGRYEFSDSYLEFNVKNISLVKNFNIAHLKFNGYLQIELNENLAYIGPKGGTSLSTVLKTTLSREIEKQTDSEEVFIHNGEEFMLDQSARDNVLNINTRINLKPFLQEGNNTFVFRGLHSESGNILNVVIDSGEYCPASLAGEESVTTDA